jgi:hypothetical protein
MTVLHSQPAATAVFVLANQLPQIVVGTHQILANEAEQRIPIYVTGLDRVTGFNLNAQLGDGSGGQAEPKFHSVDFAGGIWDAAGWSMTGGPVPGATQYAQASVVLTQPDVEVQADGLLCTLVVNTTGFAAGTAFPLKLALTDIGVDAHFLLSHGNTRAAEITNGSIELYETVVVGRHVFYNHSYFDGNDPAVNEADDAAIATNKTALLPGQQAGFANYTSYHRGLNGLMIDILGLPGAVTLNDFTFRVGNSDDLSTWTAAPAPAGFVIRAGAGASGSDRIVLTWNDQAILGQWLQVIVHRDNTGLQQDDVFYFGNAPGESGNSATNAFVDGMDFAGPRDNPRNFLNRAAITSPYDYNRDSFVDGTDMAIARDYHTNFVTALRLISPPAMAPLGSGGGGGSAGEGEAFWTDADAGVASTLWGALLANAVAGGPSEAWSGALLSHAGSGQPVAVELPGRPADHDEWFAVLGSAESSNGDSEDWRTTLAERTALTARGNSEEPADWQGIDLDVLDDVFAGY